MRPPRLGVYSDFSYRVIDGQVSAEVPFSRFIEGLRPHVERLVVIGRLSPGGEPFPYALRDAELVALPHYRSGADLAAVLGTVPASARRFWRALAELDVVWILGPNPAQAILFAALAMLRRRRVVLGVRQDLPVLIRHRRPDQPLVIASAYALEGLFRLLARRAPVAVVGPELASHYRHAAAVLPIYVSLLEASDLLSAEEDTRRYDGDELVMLSVGRLDPEKNPLLLVDVLARALQTDPRWRLEVCGDGSLAGELAARADRLGVSDRLVLRGHVPADGGLGDVYRAAHALVHVSMTEGVPQVILEAFAARLPVVATAVGGVADLVSGRGLLAPPGDADAAARGLARVAADAALRARLVAAASEAAAEHTLAAECARLAPFLSGERMGGG